MAAMRRNPAAAGVVLVVIGLLVVFGVFLALVRSIGSDASPGLLSAQGMAHRLLTGRESISTDVQTDGEYVFRVVFQGSDGNVGSTEYATHIGVAVCMRGDQAVDAVRFSYLHFKPSCSDGRVRADAGGDLDRRGPRGLRRRLRRRRRPPGRADPAKDRLALAGRDYFFFVRTLASIQS